MDFQIWLDRYADAVVTDDFDTFARMTSLPLVMETPSSSWTVATLKQLKAGFDQYRAMLESRGVNVCARTLKSVDDLPEGEVKLTYENHLVRDSIRVFAVSQNVAHLRQEDGAWKAYQVIDLPVAEGDTLPDIQITDLHRKAVENY